MSNLKQELEKKPNCRRCDCSEMEVINKNHRQLIEEVIEVHYRCPVCGYEIIIPKLIEV